MAAPSVNDIFGPQLSADPSQIDRLRYIEVSNVYEDGDQNSFTQVYVGDQISFSSRFHFLLCCAWRSLTDKLITLTGKSSSVNELFNVRYAFNVKTTRESIYYRSMHPQSTEASHHISHSSSAAKLHSKSTTSLSPRDSKSTTSLHQKSMSSLHSATPSSRSPRSSSRSPDTFPDTFAESEAPEEAVEFEPTSPSLLNALNSRKLQVWAPFSKAMLQFFKNVDFMPMDDEDLEGHFELIPECYHGEKVKYTAQFNDDSSYTRFFSFVELESQYLLFVTYGSNL